MGFSHVLGLCLQGGGVHIGDGTVTISSCTITGNTARDVRTHVQISHRPHADMPKSTLIFQFGSIFVLPGIGTCQPRLQTSDRPHGKLTFCSLFAGRWCRSPDGHGLDNVFLDLREHSYRCACSCSKVSIAPMGKCLVDMSISILIFYDGCAASNYQLGVRAICA